LGPEAAGIRQPGLLPPGSKGDDMPYLCVETNKALSPSAERVFLERATDWVETRLDKPRAVVMIAIAAGRPMTFAGSDDPTAFVRLKSVGLETEACQELAAELSRFIDTELGIAPERMFLEFQNLDRALFAWNGKTFT